MPTTKLNNGQLPTTLSSKTIDNSNDINTTTTRLKISGGSNGQVLSTDGASNLSWITASALGAPTFVVTKSADESITSSITLQDDDHLSQALTSGKTYYFEMDLIVSYTSSDVSGFRFAIGGNSNGHFGIMHQTQAANQQILMNGTNILFMQPSVASVGTKVSGTVGLYKLFGVAKMTANFTLQLRWAMQSSSINAVTIHKGSRLNVWEVA